MLTVKFEETEYVLVKDITLKTLGESDACIRGVAEFLRKIPLAEISTIHKHHNNCFFCQTMLGHIATNKNAFVWLRYNGFFELKK